MPRDLGDLSTRPEKNLTDETATAIQQYLESQRVESLPPEEPELPRSRCEVVVYSGDEPTGLLIPRALRINGEVVYTPVGTIYEMRGGGEQPVLLQLTLAPTSLCFLPGDPPDQADPTPDDAPGEEGSSSR